MKTTILTLDYSLNFEAMIAKGNYDQIDPRFISSYRESLGYGTVSFEPKLFDFNERVVRHNEMLEEIKRQGYFPAKIEHLLSYGAAFPKKQEKRPILAPTPFRFSSHGFFPFLGAYPPKQSRFVNLIGLLDGWEGATWFLGVREIQPKS